MISVGVKKLKNRLSEYLRLVKAGETVLVTDHDRVVAELRPPGEGTPRTGRDARWADLIRRGIVTPARRPGGRPPRGAAVTTLEELLRGLDEDRADRF